VVLELEPASPAEPLTDDYDARERVMRAFVSRRGQRAFRDKLIDAYGGWCAISGCATTEVLGAARIVPYRGPESNVVSNGVLLRADLHTLLDLQLLAIEPESLTVRLSGLLSKSSYTALEGASLRHPERAELGPRRELLRRQFADFICREDSRHTGPQGASERYEAYPHISKVPPPTATVPPNFV